MPKVSVYLPDDLYREARAPQPAHLGAHADDAAVRVYARLGFVGQDGFDVYVDL